MVSNARARWPAVQFEIRQVTVQGPRAVPEVSAAIAELDARPARSTSSSSPAAAARSRTCCRSATRRSSARRRRAAPRWSARSATTWTRRCSTSSPTTARRRRPTPPSGSCRTSARSARALSQARLRARAALDQRLTREQSGARPLAQPPGAGQPDDARRRRTSTGVAALRDSARRSPATPRCVHGRAEVAAARRAGAGAVARRDARPRVRRGAAGRRARGPRPGRRRRGRRAAGPGRPRASSRHAWPTAPAADAPTPTARPAADRRRAATGRPRRWAASLVDCPRAEAVPDAAARPHRLRPARRRRRPRLRAGPRRARRRRRPARGRRRDRSRSRSPSGSAARPSPRAARSGWTAHASGSSAVRDTAAGSDAGHASRQRRRGDAMSTPTTDGPRAGRSARRSSTSSPRPDGTRAQHPGGSPANVALGLGRLGRRVDLLTWLGARRRRRPGAPRTSRRPGVHRPAGQPLGGCARPWRPRTLDADGRRDLRVRPRRGTCPRRGTTTPADPLVVHTGSIATVLQPGGAAVARDRRAAPRDVDHHVRPEPAPGRSWARPRTPCRSSTRSSRLADVVKVSDEDLAWLHPGVAPAEIAEEWSRSGPSLVVVTHGGEGAFASTSAGARISRRGPDGAGGGHRRRRRLVHGRPDRRAVVGRAARRGPSAGARRRRHRDASRPCSSGARGSPRSRSPARAPTRRARPSWLTRCDRPTARSQSRPARAELAARSTRRPGGRGVSASGAGLLAGLRPLERRLAVGLVLLVDRRAASASRVRFSPVSGSNTMQPCRVEPERARRRRRGPWSPSSSATIELGAQALAVEVAVELLELSRRRPGSSRTGCRRRARSRATR